MEVPPEVLAVTVVAELVASGFPVPRALERDKPEQMASVVVAVAAPERVAVLTGREETVAPVS